MSSYQDSRQQHLAAWATALPERLERLGWARERLDAHRTAALRSLVRTARDRSPWHAERLAGIDIDALDAGDLSALPVMTKDDLMSHFDDIVTDRRVTLEAAESHLATLDGDDYFLDGLHVVASGGSSGRRGVFVYGWDAWVDVHQGLSRWVLADRLRDPTSGAGPLSMGLVTASNATHMTTAVAATFASPMVTATPFPVTLPLAEIVAGLEALQPETLTAYASMFHVLAAEATAGRLRIRPRRLVATSEPLLPEVRAAAEAAFDAPISNVWGTSEAGVMAVGCWQSDGMHVNEDLVILEPVDEANRPVPPGERSAKTLVTNLFNPLQPLIRYELTDEVVAVDKPCACGSLHRRVADVAGRADDVFSYGRVVVHPHVLRSALSRQRDLLDYQVRQTPTGVDVDVVPGTRFAPEQVAEALRRALRKAGLPEPTVDVRVVAAVARHALTGKLRRFVPAPSPASPSTATVR